jgi:sugar lactone lactonase YvrE
MTIIKMPQGFVKYSLAIALITALSACGGVDSTSSSSSSSSSTSGSSQALDTTPDAFSFTPVSNAALGSEISSDSVTISGINTPADISISGGTYAIDGSAFSAAASKVANGQKIVVKLASSAVPATTSKATLTIGGLAADFVVTSAPSDTTPDAFTFTDIVTSKLNTLVSSNAVTITGINQPTRISVVGGKYAINNGAFTDVVGTITNGQTVTLQTLSAGAANSSSQVTLTLGGVVGTLKVSTVLPEPKPYLQGGAIQGTSLNLGNRVSTFAGAPAQADGIGKAASFQNPSGVVSDGINLYVADTDNHSIRKIEIATGAVTTLAGSGLSGNTDGVGAAASFYVPEGIASDGTSLYVADSGNKSIRKIEIATGAVTTLAGGSYGNADGVSAVARFDSPRGIATDGSNLYVADTGNHSILKIDMATGAVTTLAGSSSRGDADGVGAAASFFWPEGITTDGTNLYVADFGNSRIRKIEIATGAVSTLAGGSFGNADGVGTVARFDSPRGITTDGSNLYVVDTRNNSVRKIEIATGAVTTLAGSGAAGSADGVGAAASFAWPRGITTDGTNLYVADSYNYSIRKIEIATGAVSTLAGGSYGNADGVSAVARFYFPRGITTDGSNLYLADSSNYRIRKIDMATGVVTTLAGSFGGNGDGVGAEASFFHPQGITTDGSNLYVADSGNNRIRKIEIATGAVSTLAGSSWGNDNGVGVAARFAYPSSITTDGTSLYVVDTDNHSIRKIEMATGVVTTLAGSGSYGNTDGVGTAASFGYPAGITTDGTNLYVADTYNHSIRKIEIATGAVTTLAGGSFGNADGVGDTASFNRPSGITTDGHYLYVSDTSNQRIRKIDLATGAVTSLAGSDRGYANGTGAQAKFYDPRGITTDGRSLFVVDTENWVIRKID